MQFAVSAHADMVESGRGRVGRALFSSIAILAFAGMIVSAVSVQRHYAKSASSFCEIGEKFSCDIVNRSEYSSLM
jgi:hypothetical protein